MGICGCLQFDGGEREREIVEESHAKLMDHQWKINWMNVHSPYCFSCWHLPFLLNVDILHPFA